MSRHNAGEGSYAIGYGKPPVQNRFKPGISGNPKGRPRHRKTLAALLHAILNEKVSVRTGNKVQPMIQFEAIMRGVAVRALKGDVKSIKTVLDLAMAYDAQINPPQGGAMTIRFVHPDKPEKKP